MENKPKEKDNINSISYKNEKEFYEFHKKNMERFRLRFKHIHVVTK